MPEMLPVFPALSAIMAEKNGPWYLEITPGPASRED
jgi:hypothetical protein